MTDPVPSKELGDKEIAAELRATSKALEAHRLPYSAELVVRAASEIEHVRRENVRWENAHKILLSENDRLRRQVDELSTHAEKWVKRALGGATHEPGEVATDAERWQTYLKCYDREEMVAAEWDGPAAITAFIDSQRLAQPPRDEQ